MHKALQTSRTILAVDGDSSTRAVIGETLQKEGHRVIEAPDAQSALRLARQHRPDVIILDSMVSGMSGFELCSQLRMMPYVDHTPILFLSANKSAVYVAKALDAGGDDYLRKPFAARELRARVHALLRRAIIEPEGHALPVLQLDRQNHDVAVNGRRIVLTPTEFQLIEYLCENQNHYHSAPRLLEVVWQYPPGTGDTALVRNHVRNLRRKIELNPNLPEIIVSQHGRGYSVRAAVL